MPAGPTPMCRTRRVMRKPSDHLTAALWSLALAYVLTPRHHPQRVPGTISECRGVGLQSGFRQQVLSSGWSAHACHSRLSGRDQAVWCSMWPGDDLAPCSATSHFKGPEACRCRGLLGTSIRSDSGDSSRQYADGVCEATPEFRSSIRHRWTPDWAIWTHDPACTPSQSSVPLLGSHHLRGCATWVADPRHTVVEAGDLSLP